MRSLNGYKVVTKFIVSERCEWPGCLKDGTHAMSGSDEPWWDAGMYCMYHAISVALHGKIKKEKGEGE